jgi:cytochrome c553
MTDGGFMRAAAAGALLWLAWAPALAGAGAGESPGIEQKAQLCFACHGPNGASTSEKYPNIAGQTQYYLYLQLKDFKAGRRENAEMKPIMDLLAPEELMPLAEYFSQQRWPALANVPDPAKAGAGEIAAAAGECPQCHLGGYNGASGVPRLAGQHAAYLEKTMLDLKSKARNNAPAMSALMAAFSDEDIAALAHYLAALTIQEAARAVEIQ